jgi:LacI family transcriptional regulator
LEGEVNVKQMSRSPVRLKDIARDLNVSVITVSKVLRNHSDISRETRERVLTRMRELNYQPNRAARSLVTGRSFTIGLVVPDLEHPFFAEIAKAIARTIRARDYSLIIASSEEDPTIEIREVENLLSRQIDALVFASTQRSARSPVFELLATTRLPYVLIDRRFPGLAANYVGVDDIEVGRTATEHLIALGYRRIAHLRGPEVSTGKDRLKGYQQALAKHNIKVQSRYILELEAGDNCSEEHGQEATRRLLALKPRPEAVFCYNDEVAAGALRAIGEAGLEIPDDIAVIGVDNNRYADLLRVPLTSIDQKTYQIGERAADLALTLIDASSPSDPKEVILPINLVARQSTVGSALTNGSGKKK